MARIIVRVRMEPELEEIAGHLASYERLEMAAKLERWAHQLRVSSRMLSLRRPSRPKKLRKLGQSKLGMN